MTATTTPMTVPDVHDALWASLRTEPFGRARDRLIELYLPLSRKIAASVRRERNGADLDLDDLRQYAVEGLLQAIDRYDPARGAPFEAFAQRRIKGSVLDGIGESSELRRQSTFRRRIRAERTRSLTNPASEAMSSGEALQALADLAVDLALGFILDDAAAQGDEPRSREPNAYESLAWTDTVRRVAQAVEGLPEQEQRIVRLHYLQGLEFARIAEVVNLSRGRVSQIHAAALQRLRKRLPRADHLQTHL